MRAAYTAQVSRYLDLLKRLSEEANAKWPRQQAIATLSALVGAACLARAVDGEALSSEILETTADALIRAISAPA